MAPLYIMCAFVNSKFNRRFGVGRVIKGRGIREGKVGAVRSFVRSNHL